jgi:hypothetical protein
VLNLGEILKNDIIFDKKGIGNFGILIEMSEEEEKFRRTKNFLGRAKQERKSVFSI